MGHQGTELPPEVREELDGLEAVIQRRRRGELSEGAFKPLRTHQGVYGIRGHTDQHMIRVKVPAGGLTGLQLRMLGEIAATLPWRGAVITTRQDIQFHYVEQVRVTAIRTRLAEAGLTTREACGNSVRNVTASPEAGVCPNEAFDVGPYARSLMRYFLRHPLVQNLPRKFKIAFSCCDNDTGLTRINDIGWLARARVVEGTLQRGFRVVVGGGLGTMPQIAWPLYEFLPAERMLPVAHAILDVFNREGNRENRNQARLKFLIRKLGFDGFREAFEEALARVEREGVFPPVPFPGTVESEPVGVGGEPASPSTEEERVWRERCVEPQRQPGFVMVRVWVPVGLVTGAQLVALADLLDAVPGASLQTTHDQNVLLRWVPRRAIGDVLAKLQAMGLAQPHAGSILDVVACPGVPTCQLGITRTKDAAREITRALVDAGLDGALRGDRIFMSGCPNSCGQHHLGAIGLYGVAMRQADRELPAYQVLVGGSNGPEGATLAQRSVKVPAKQIGPAVVRLARLYLNDRRPGERLAPFLRRMDPVMIAEALRACQATPAVEADPGAFVDWGGTEPFTTKDRGPGECAT